MASFLPFRPSFRWTLGSSVLGGWRHVSISPIASPALRRHRSVSRPVRCQTLVSRRLPEPTRLAPRLSSSALQHVRRKEPFFLHSFQSVRKTFALSSGSLPLRVWLPSRGSSFPHPGEPFSAPNTRGLRSSELFSFPVIEKPFRASLSALALPSKPLTASDRRFSGFLPPEKPCPSLLPEGLVRVGTSCSLELLDLSGSLVLPAWKKVSLFFPSPFALRPETSYDVPFPEP